MSKVKKPKTIPRIYNVGEVFYANVLSLCFYLYKLSHSKHLVFFVYLLCQSFTLFTPLFSFEMKFFNKMLQYFLVSNDLIFIFDR